ncbi:hypothetical protein [Oryza sativa Japonica Group]|uniref:Uncharacterized protein n=1 Tax=Oryza sativa subsp. japonica TaxID=39947 RepID=Q5N906_ORYSJ|nr:hypothetical protein [Oryza sativa Japonica Group]
MDGRATGGIGSATAACRNRGDVRVKAPPVRHIDIDGFLVLLKFVVSDVTVDNKAPVVTSSISQGFAGLVFEDTHRVTSRIDIRSIRTLVEHTRPTAANPYMITVNENTPRDEGLWTASENGSSLLAQAVVAKRSTGGGDLAQGGVAAAEIRRVHDDEQGVIVLFALLDKTGILPIDHGIIYALLLGGLVLDVDAILMLLSSNQMIFFFDRKPKLAWLVLWQNMMLSKEFLGVGDYESEAIYLPWNRRSSHRDEDTEGYVHWPLAKAGSVSYWARAKSRFSLYTMFLCQLPRVALWGRVLPHCNNLYYKLADVHNPIISITSLPASSLIS